MLNLHVVGGSEPIPKISVLCLFSTSLGTAEIWWWITPFRCTHQRQIGAFTSLEWGFDSVTRTTGDDVMLKPKQILSISFPLFMRESAFPLQGVMKCVLFRDIDGQLTEVTHSPDYPLCIAQKQDAVHVS